MREFVVRHGKLLRFRNRRDNFYGKRRDDFDEGFERGARRRNENADFTSQVEEVYLAPPAEEEDDEERPTVPSLGPDQCQFTGARLPPAGEAGACYDWDFSLQSDQESGDSVLKVVYGPDGLLQFAHAGDIFNP
ncbi:MAG: hypothetical protein K2W82_16330 [Candidatus Obscuribacterales bacterium]|nr:hypothetical protein [Candidatus Obscuribacterales bacterium]